MSKGFGQLAALQKLDLSHCYALKLLPDSKSLHLESLYFLIFDVQRLRYVDKLEGPQPVGVRIVGIAPRK